MAGKLVYEIDNELVEFDDTPENRQQADQAGMRQYVDMLDPDGQPVSFPVEESTQALNLGFKIPGVEVPQVTPGAAGTPIEALALGAVGGYTLGAGEAAVSGIAGKQQVEALKKENPTAYLVGQVGGSIASPVSLGGAILGKLGNVAKNSAVAGKVAKLVQDSAFLSRLVPAAQIAGAGGKAAVQAATDTAAQGLLEGKSLEQVKEDSLQAAKLGGGLGIGLKTLGTLNKVAGEALTTSAQKTKEHLVGLDTKEVQAAVKTFGKGQEDLYQAAKQYDLIPRIGLNYDKAADKADTLLTQANVKLDNVYGKLDEMVAEKPKVTDVLDQYRQQMKTSKLRAQGPELEKELAPLKTRVQATDQEIARIKESVDPQLLGSVQKIEDLETRKKTISSELLDLEDQIFSSAPVNKLNAKINLKQSKLDELENLEKAPPGTADRAEILRAEIDELNAKILVIDPRYAELSKRQKSIENIDRVLDKTYANYIRQADKADLKQLKSLNTAIERKVSISKDINDSLVKPEFRKTIKDFEQVIGSKMDEMSTAEGFASLRNVKNELFERARGIKNTSERTAALELAYDFDRFLKSKIQSIPEDKLAEFKQANDEVSKLITLRNSLATKAGKDYSNAPVPMHQAAFGLLKAARGNIPGAVPHFVPNITGATTRGSIATGKELLGTKLQRAGERQGAEDLASKVARAKALRDEDNKEGRK